ncbi:MAG: BolA family transcriptional regulator [Alphaproteobacteria bacterium]|nr:BolA family transcriptional regulator [Alphaproteobacteria bacterium]
MTMADTIHGKLAAAFAPSDLAVTDDSARHAGHAGHRPEGETHFIVKIVSSAFVGLSRVERQRRVYAVLEQELKTSVHALNIRASAPGED